MLSVDISIVEVIYIDYNRGSALHFFASLSASKQTDSIGAALNIVNDFVGEIVDVSLEIGKYLYNSSTRPNNIGAGTYRKYVSAQIASITKTQSFASKTFGVISYAFVVIDAGELAYAEAQAGLSSGKIIWDFSVEVVTGSVGVLISTAIGTFAGTLIANPIAGAAVGAVVGIAVGKLYDWIVYDPKNSIKGLV